jgi:GNAT superfamily N-acetyltransferase
MPAGAATLRAAAAADARSLAEVHVASWRWAYRGILPGELLDGLSVDEREADWCERLVAGEEAGTIVAERDGRIVGFASGAASRDDDAVPVTGEVLAVYLAEDEAGRGTGAALLDAILEVLAARGFTRATLWVLETNERARGFYERHGWTLDGSTSTHQVQCDHRPVVRYATELKARPLGRGPGGQGLA